MLITILAYGKFLKSGNFLEHLYYIVPYECYMYHMFVRE